MLLFPEMRVTRKIFTWAAANLLFNQFNWFFLSLHLQNYFSLLKNKESHPLLFKEKKG